MVFEINAFHFISFSSLIRFGNIVSFSALSQKSWCSQKLAHFQNLSSSIGDGIMTNCWQLVVICIWDTVILGWFTSFLSLMFSLLTSTFDLIFEKSIHFSIFIAFLNYSARHFFIHTFSTGCSSYIIISINFIYWLEARYSWRNEEMTTTQILDRFKLTISYWSYHTVNPVSLHILRWSFNYNITQSRQDHHPN